MVAEKRNQKQRDCEPQATSWRRTPNFGLRGFLPTAEAIEEISIATSKPTPALFLKLEQGPPKLELKLGKINLEGVHMWQVEDKQEDMNEQPEMRKESR